MRIAFRAALCYIFIIIYFECNLRSVFEMTKNNSARRHNRMIKYLIIGVFLLLLCLILFDARLKTVHYTVDAPELDGSVRIALVTDLHSCRYGKNQQKLIDAIDRQQPDIILLGGDIIDDHMAFDNSEIFLAAIAKKYPCYYVTGNHEYWSRRIGDIFDIMHSNGITVLSGDCRTLEVNGQRFNLCGVDDPDAAVYSPGSRSITEQLSSAGEGCEEGLYTLLLSHRPELFDLYCEYDFDLVLSGHAHGGQWKIPFILNGLYAPNQGLFPKLAGGRYEQDGCTMIVSRGLARESTRVPRIFNRPELVIVDIE